MDANILERNICRRTYAQPLVSYIEISMGSGSYLVFGSPRNSFLGFQGNLPLYLRYTGMPTLEILKSREPLPLTTKVSSTQLHHPDGDRVDTKTRWIVEGDFKEWRLNMMDMAELLSTWKRRCTYTRNRSWSWIGMKFLPHSISIGDGGN